MINSIICMCNIDNMLMFIGVDRVSYFMITHRYFYRKTSNHPTYIAISPNRNSA